MERDADDEPLAAWEALLLPQWRWEAYEKEEDDLYFGRVKSPLTYDNWEWGYFSKHQLRKAGAYRVDVDIDEGEDPYPDGGFRSYSTDETVETRFYETELDALDELYEGDP